MRETLLAVEDIFHPGQCGAPWTAGRLSREVDRHRERTQVPFKPTGRTIDCPPAQLDLAVRSFAQTISGGEKVVFRHDCERTLADLTERRCVIDGLVDIEQQHAAHPRCLPLPFLLSLRVRFLGCLLGLLLNLRHAVAKCVDEIVVHLPVAFPNVAQQIQMPLSCRHPAQVKYRIIVHKTCIVFRILMGNPELWKNDLGDRMQGCQRCMLPSLSDHHLITEMFGILLERRQFRQRAFANQEFLQRRTCAGIQALFDEAYQTPALGDSTSLMMVCSVV